MKTLPKREIGEWKLPEECIACDAVDSYAQVQVETEKDIRGETFKVTHMSWRCQSCGQGVLSPEQADDAMRAVVAAYQTAHNLLTASEMVKMRKKMKLSQKQLADQSELGIASIKRWESGLVLQTPSNDAVLRSALCATPTSAGNPMATIKKRLSKVGITRNYLRDYVLPEGWNDSKAKEPKGLLEAAALIMQRFGFALDSLLDDSQDLRFATTVGARFKKRQSTDVDNLKLCEAMCGQFAKMLVGALSGTPKKPLPPADELRTQLLEAESHGGGIGFDQLVNVCWDHGIPVVHLSNFPKCHKPDAMALMIEDRPVIVLCKNRHSAAWMSFYLAHEMGHIQGRHVTNEIPFVDDKLKMPGETNGTEIEEEEANDYAVGLLMDDLRLVWPKGQIKATELVRLSRHNAAKLKIAPGAVALSYAYQEGHWDIANHALKTLEKGVADPIETINRIAFERLNWDEVREGSRDWFIKLTGYTAR